MFSNLLQALAHLVYISAYSTRPLALSLIFLLKNHKELLKNGGQSVFGALAPWFFAPPEPPLGKALLTFQCFSFAKKYFQTSSNTNALTF